MVKTLNQMVDTVLEELSSFKVTDDFPLVRLRDYIKLKFIGINGSLMREEYEKGRKINEQFYQRFPCVEVECLGVTCTIGGITVTKTLPIYKVIIPHLQTGVGYLDIRYFGKNDYRKMFTRAYDFMEFSNTGFRIYTGRRPVFLVANEKEIFVENLPTIGTRSLAMIVLLADPRNAPGWSDDTSMFPTPSPYKLEMLVKADIAKTLPLGPDLLDDAQRLRSSMAPQRQTESQDEPVQ